MKVRADLNGTIAGVVDFESHAWTIGVERDGFVAV
jgi:hypothetical protein